LTEKKPTSLPTGKRPTIQSQAKSQVSCEGERKTKKKNSEERSVVYHPKRSTKDLLGERGTAEGKIEV